LEEEAHGFNKWQLGLDKYPNTFGPSFFSASISADRTAPIATYMYAQDLGLRKPPFLETNFLAAVL
jgi:hypothetical protein